MPSNYPEQRSNKRPQEKTASADYSTVLDELMLVIQQRKKHPPERSYTTTLFAGGVPLIGKKVLEEAQEVVEAAGQPGDAGHAHLVHEAADLIYHLFVLLGHREVSLQEVQQELAKRAGISGLDEKQSRQQ